MADIAMIDTNADPDPDAASGSGSGSGADADNSKKKPGLIAPGLWRSRRPG
jgi:hypothetical protein